MDSLRHLSEWTGQQMSRRAALRLLGGAAAGLSGFFLAPPVFAGTGSARTGSPATAVYKNRFFAVSESGQPISESPQHCCPLYSCILQACDNGYDCPYDPNQGQYYNYYLCTDECTGEQHYECTIIVSSGCGPYYCSCNYGYC